MNFNLLKKIGIGFAIVVVVIYALFLILPFIITPIAKNYIPMVNDEIKKATGLISQIEDFKIITTPKFTVGAELGKFAILTPQNKEIFEAEDFSVKMSFLFYFVIIREGDFQVFSFFNCFLPMLQGCFL